MSAGELTRRDDESHDAWCARVWAAIMEINALKDQLERDGLIPVEAPSLEIWPPRFAVQ